MEMLTLNSANTQGFAAFGPDDDVRVSCGISIKEMRNALDMIEHMGFEAVELGEVIVQSVTVKGKPVGYPQKLLVLKPMAHKRVVDLPYVVTIDECEINRDKAVVPEDLSKAEGSERSDENERD